LTLAIVSDTDGGPDSEGPQRFQAEVVDVEQLDKVPSKVDVSAPAITNFQQHVRTVFTFLKRAGTLKTKLVEMEKDGQDTTELSSQYRALEADLKFYITRTCFQKISTRAGYHCAALDSKDPEEDQGQKSGCSSKDDFTRLLYPMCSWKTDHEELAKQFGTQLRGIYRSVLSKEPFSFDMDKIFKDKDKEKEKAERAKFDPDMWTDDKWTQPEPLNIEFLRDYAPVMETNIWKHLSKKFKLEPIPKEKGFYLTAPGRRAYHQLVTTCVWNALLYLQLLKKHEARVEKDRQSDTDIQKLTNKATWALHCLQMLAYGNPIIGIHLDWLDKKNPNNKRKSKEVENPTNGDITGEEADIVPSLKGMVLGQSDGTAKALSSTFLVSGGRGAAVLRWLRLITLHHFAIWTLLSTKTVLKLPQLSINLVKTGLPIELNQMQSLQSYLSKMKKPKNSDDITLVINALERSEREVDIFRGTYHCEAILLSLYLLHYEARANAANDFSALCQSVGVDPFLAEAAGSFFTRVVAVSKRCCPVCNELFRVMSDVLKKQYSITGSHTAYSPCALPPFLPKKYADMVADALETRLETRLGEYVTVQRNRQFQDRGSASPVQHLEGDWDIDQPDSD
jgi:hypothetical protein